MSNDAATGPDNPLLDLSGPPRYDRIRAEHVVPAIRRRIDEAEALTERFHASGEPPTWRGFVAPVEDAEEALSRAWSAVENLDSTIGTPAIREAHRAAQDLVTRHAAKAGQDERSYRAALAIAEGPEAAALGPVRRKVLADHLRDFRLAGVHLPPQERARCAEIRTELAACGSEFADHVTDDANRYRLVLTRAEQVQGLPPQLVEAARARALADDPQAPAQRWSFALDQATVVPFTSTQRDRGLREEILRAWTTRGTAAPFDNGPLIRHILQLRRELAGRLGFANYAELSLVRKMARSPEQVREFLLGLADQALPRARAEIASLKELAEREDGVTKFERYDLAYYRERLRHEVHGFSQEELRQYFPLPRVLAGLAEVFRRLYGITIRDRTADGVLATWHADVRVLEITEDGRTVGHILFDPCARRGKRSGAWVSTCVARHRRADDSLVRPVSHLVCNFPPPSGHAPSLLSHDEVRTLFHEFGHALHSVLTKVDERAVAGTHGVPWDGVEFPSQFHENWIWQPESLALVSGHVETGAQLPSDLLARLRASRDFLAANDLLRQVELALFDLELHTTFDPDGGDPHELAESVRRRVSAVPAPAYDRFENSFLHVFHGAYAAGYYGYKWAEVLAADAFQRFEDEGIFSERAAGDFRRHVLETGGSEDFLGLFVRFRGREPDPSALLRQCGIA